MRTGSCRTLWGLQTIDQADFPILRPITGKILPDAAALDRASGRRNSKNTRLAAVRNAELAEAGRLIDPSAAYARLEADDIVRLPERLRVAFQGAQAAVAVVCTIGEGLEKHSRELFDSSEYAHGWFLDLIGTLAVTRLADAAARELVGDEAGARWAPGDDREDPGMEAQRLLFDLVPARMIGVRLSDHNVMLPVKSLSFFILLGAIATMAECTGSCALCARSAVCDRH